MVSRGNLVTFPNRRPSETHRMAAHIEMPSLATSSVRAPGNIQAFGLALKSLYLLRSFCVHVLVYKLDRGGTLSHGRCDALDGAVSCVAGCKHSRHAGLQEKRVALESPPAGRMARAEQVATGQDVSLGIHLDRAREPLSMGGASDENEQPGGTQFLALTVDAFHSDCLEASVTMAVDHPSPVLHVDGGKRTDLANEVVGHACSKRLAAHDHRDTRSEPRQMYSRLSRRVTSAHDKDLLACATWCFAHGGAVENTSSHETLEARYVQVAVGHTSCDNSCPTFYLSTVRKGRDEAGPVCAQPDGCLREDYRHAEPL